MLHSFGSFPDAESPLAGMLAGKNGEYYGTTQSGGNPGNGAIYEVTAAGSEQVIYSFQSGTDGADPVSTLIMDKKGALYGTSDTGGSSGCEGPGCGTVFKLTPNQQGWTESVLYRFTGGNDGGSPIGGLLMTKRGALLGTTVGGGSGGGVVFELMPSGSTYTETVVHEFSGSPDGLDPTDALVSDSAGNLYGTTSEGGLTTCPSRSSSPGCGTVFKLAPSGSKYSYSVIYRFKGDADGIAPWASLLRGSNGVFYGLTMEGGALGKGTAFELTPKGSRYRETVLYSFKGRSHGAYPRSDLVEDRGGNLYGTTPFGGGAHCRDGCGTVFTLAPSGKTFTEHVLYTFQGPRAGDGAIPLGGVLIDRHRNLLGTTFNGGASHYGTIFSVCCAASSPTLREASP
ncbi:MAG TPA: choice-of-anchor tandem repeat GloVer-containing protein [Candidatus Cybelea sp.]